MIFVANLRGCTDTQLLEFVRDILSAHQELTAQDRAELTAINDEFFRRDAMRALDICHYCNQVTADGSRCRNCGSM